jgi:lipopolysaccharide export system protein LptA
MNPSLKLLSLRLAPFVACLFALPTAWVQALPEDRNQALHISADKQEVDLKQGVVVYSGDVKLVQGTLEITAQRIHVRRDKDQQVESFTADGNPARYQQQPEAGKPLIHAEASTIRYNLKTEELVLDKNVSIEQNGSVTKAGHVDYDIKSQTAKFSGTGRVETVIPAKPEKKD